jgi:hypothetical protein
MSVADVLSDAVGMLDEYVRDPRFEGSVSRELADEIKRVRSEMNELRTKLDSASMERLTRRIIDHGV